MRKPKWITFRSSHQATAPTITMTMRVRIAPVSLSLVSGSGILPGAGRAMLGEKRLCPSPPLLGEVACRRSRQAGGG
jgi:hypothetical protein